LGSGRRPRDFDFFRGLGGRLSPESLSIRLAFRRELHRAREKIQRQAQLPRVQLLRFLPEHTSRQLVQLRLQCADPPLVADQLCAQHFHLRCLPTQHFHLRYLST